MSTAHRIAEKHIPFFAIWYHPMRMAVLNAIREALATLPPKEPEA